MGGGVVLEAFAQRVVLERLDEVVDDPAPQGPADGVDLAGRGDHQHVDVRGLGAEPFQHLHAVPVGQVDVEQHQVRVQLVTARSASAPVWTTLTTSNPGVRPTNAAWILAP